jgi:hypothetical protein
MKTWPRHPVIYEINTCVWLNELSQAGTRPVTLASVPGEEWDRLAGWPIDAVWFMGVWERSPEGTAIANRNAGLLQDFRRALPDFRPEDNIGSPYCIRRYVVDGRFGGPEGLSRAREALARRGIRLILDFVPNHVAPDHPWVTDHPDYFVRGNQQDASNDPASFVVRENEVFACGRDPYFPAWPDVLQLNAFNPGLREAVIGTLADIAGQCDGVRCDMAMLLINDVFERTWGSRAGQRLPTEYWVEAIAATKKAHPAFLMMAEAYWDLEWKLQQQGFDYCYDKRLYDRLEHDGAESIRRHLCADMAYQNRLVRFIENHDEPRVRSVFSDPKARAAAVTMATVVGAKLFHEGQFEGRTVRPPVFLNRRPVEPADLDLQAWYRVLLKAASLEALRHGDWQLCNRTGWPDNPSCQNLVTWCSRGPEGRHLVVVNLSDSPAQGLVWLPWDDLKSRVWKMTDLFTEAEYERSGDDLCGSGLYVELPPWGYHVLAGWVPKR